jgi:flagellar biosynthesis GTPase FlhF
MTTIIIVIAVIAIVAGLIAKIPKKGSSGKKGSSKSSKAESAQPKLRDPNQAKKAKAMVEKALKMSPEMGVENIKFYRPPEEPELFIGRKEIFKDVVARTGKSPVMISFNGPAGIGKTTLAIMMMKRFSSQFSGDQVLWICGATTRKPLRPPK